MNKLYMFEEHEYIACTCVCVVFIASGFLVEGGRIDIGIVQVSGSSPYALGNGWKFF